MSQNRLMEQLDEKHIYMYAEQLEYAVRRLQNTNENLQSTLDQYKMKIAELEEKDIQSKKRLYEEIQQSHSYYAKIQYLVRINEELSREIDLNNMTKRMRELNEEDKRKLRPGHYS